MAIVDNTNLPGVHVREVSGISPSVQSVSSSVAAFVGRTDEGTVGVPTVVENWLDFVNNFGEALIKHTTTVGEITVTTYNFFVMPAAVRAFFENGGSKAYIVRVDNQTDPSSFANSSDYNNAFSALESEDEPSIIACPDMSYIKKLVGIDEVFLFTEIAANLISHCEKMGDRFGIIDIPNVRPLSTTLETISAAHYVNLINTPSNAQYAAAYYPHLSMSQYTQPVPPSGHVAGAMAATDTTRGVWKAPANIALRATAVTQKVTDSQQNTLNGIRVNVIRSFTGRGIRIWGARTLFNEPTDQTWRYVNVRRFFTMVEESVKKSTAWAVFEPNSPSTWRTVKVMLENYFTNLWKAGALLGSEPKHAFIVKIGLGETMDEEDVLAGRMVIEVGLAAVRPAEFIYFLVSHKNLEV